VEKTYYNYLVKDKIVIDNTIVDIYKIGRSDSPLNRVRQFKCGNPTCELFMVLKFDDYDECKRNEEKLHREYNEFNYNNVVGYCESNEWFILPKEKVDEIINNNKWITKDEYLNHVTNGIKIPTVKKCINKQPKEKIKPLSKERLKPEKREHLQKIVHLQIDGKDYYYENLVVMSASVGENVLGIKYRTLKDMRLGSLYNPEYKTPTGAIIKVERINVNKKRELLKLNGCRYKFGLTKEEHKDNVLEGTKNKIIELNELLRKKDYGEFNNWYEFHEHCYNLKNKYKNYNISLSIDNCILRLNGEKLSSDTVIIIPASISRRLDNLISYELDTNVLTPHMSGCAKTYDSGIYSNISKKYEVDGETYTYKVSLNFNGAPNVSYFNSLEEALKHRNELACGFIRTLADEHKDILDERAYEILSNFNLDTLIRLKNVPKYKIYQTGLSLFNSKYNLNEEIKNFVEKTV